MVTSWIMGKKVSLYDDYLWMLSLADKRVENWPLMNSPKYTILLTVMYLAFCFCGPKLMKYYRALELRSILVVYNVATVAINAYICVEILTIVFKAGYNLSCQPIDFSNNPLAIRMAAVLWLFYITKLFGFLDTIFFVLRKKFHQLSFLHIYHHSSIFLFNWHVVKLTPGGSAFVAALLNSFVRVLTYKYCVLAAVSPKTTLRLKKYLTAIQIGHFIVVAVHGMNALRLDCPSFPHPMIYTLIGYMISFIILFVIVLCQWCTDTLKKQS